MARDGTWPIIDRRSPEDKLERDLWDLPEQDGDRWVRESIVALKLMEDFVFTVDWIVHVDWSFAFLISNFKMLQADVIR